MAYYFWERLGIVKGEQYRQLLEKAFKLGWSQTKTFTEARRLGLGYAEALMREDWHRFSYVESARTYTGKLKVHDFFDGVVAKLHYEKKWSWKEIREFLKERKEPAKWTPETKAKEKVFREYAKKVFPELYPD